MIRRLNQGRIWFCFLFLSFYLYSCTRPGDNPLNKKDLDQPAVPFVTQKSSPQLHVVEISEMKFQPADIMVHTGDTIVWVNKDITTHCVTGEPPEVWTSLSIPRDSSWKMIVKNNADYYCAIHKVMKGKITVK